MAAIRLQPGHPQRVGIFDVIGEMSDSGHVRHVAIIRTANMLSHANSVEVFHSGPPLEVGQMNPDGEPVHGEMPAHIVGWVDDLEIEEWQGIQAWIEDVRTRISPGRFANYRIDPPVLPIRDNITNTIINWQYSCVGFVMRCYEEGAGIDLLRYDPDRLPAVELNTLAEVYGDGVARAEQMRAKFGIAGDGPWRIVLAGYIFHALARPIGEIRSAPYEVVSLAEATFP